MQLEGRTVLLTGANRGLGRHLAHALLERGATVLAAARDPRSITTPGLIPLRIDLSDRQSIARLATETSGVSVIINNAGSYRPTSFVGGDRELIELDMRTNYSGPLDVVRAFNPQLAAHEVSGILNVLSVLSWFSSPDYAGYGASKAAAWSMTNGLRSELVDQHTQVTGLFVGYMDTDMTRGLDAPKVDPAAVAKLALDGFEAGELEILADDISRYVRARLSDGVDGLYPRHGDPFT